MENKRLYPFDIFEKRPSMAVETLREYAKTRRLEKGISRKQLSQLSEVPVPTIERFETSGKISLDSFAKIVCSLGYYDELVSVLSGPKYRTMDELKEIQDNEFRKRGKRYKSFL